MTASKIVLNAASGVGGAGLDVDEVFSTYLYTGNGSTQTITNGIDLSGEGGLVWIKSRTGTTDHWLSDSERAYTTRFLRTNLTNAEANNNASVTSYSADGFSVGSASAVNTNGNDYVSWTFRKAPKFFDVVTWTGNAVSGREIPHNLGSAPGMIIVKSLTEARQWMVYHRSTGNANALIVNSTAASASTALWNSTDPTSTVFTLNNDGDVNTTGNTYVAYLFAHNDGDGDFGPDADADAIKCGSYTGTGATGNNVNLGFEPQWLMIKRTDSTGNWQIADVMRGMPNNGGAGAYQRLSANLSSAEVNGQEGPIPTSTGFVLNSTSTDTNGNGNTYIYIAIRRPTAVPESATDVFASDFARAAADGNKPEYRSGFPVDTRLTLYRPGGSSSYPAIGSRITGNEYLVTSSTAAGGAWTAQTFDYMNGFMNTAANVINTTLISHMWKRAPNFFDVVAYTGTGSTRTVAHNLGAAPEMMWFKGRNQSAYNWMVYHKNISPADGIYLSDSGAASGASFQFANTAPTATVFTVSSGVDVNSSNEPYIAYLFASLDGVSKVGSVTHSGTTNVDCGFSSGARFVLLKRTDATGDWYVWDSTRGIVSGNDPYLLLNTTAAEVTNTDYIDPLSSGFTITSSLTAGDYIFYAIA